MCLLSNFIKFSPAVAKETSKMSQPIRRQGDHLCFPIDSKKKTTLGRGLEVGAY